MEGRVYHCQDPRYVLKEYETTPLKESITKLINSKNSIIRTIEKIKQQKLNKQLNINQEPQTDDDILKDLEDASDDDDDDDDDDDWYKVYKNIL